MNSPVAGMLMDRVTQLLGAAQVGVEKSFRVGGQGERTPRALFTSGASLDWDRIKGAFPRQPLSAAWKDLHSTALNA